MNFHSNTEFSHAPDFPGHLPSLEAPLPSMRFPSQYHLVAAEQLALNELDWVNEAQAQFSHNSCSSGGSGYGSPSSMASYGAQRPSFMQISVSSQSLQKNGARQPVSAIFAELLLDSENCPVRRVCSTGDLQKINGNQTDSPLSSESSMIIEGMSRACPYNPEEKKARIERYRSKRNRRNFNKKIKYACRKTLADSRPRIRGRFARNGEIEKNPPAVEWNQVGGEEEDEEDENWVNLFDNLVAANIAQQPQDNFTYSLMF